MGVWQDFLYFSRPQRRAITLLLVLNALLCSAFFFLPIFFAPPPIDFSAFEEEVNRFYAEAEERETPTLKAFDPNTVSAEALDSMGVSGEVGRRIIRFREKGGRFSRPADLRKIYGMDDSLYRRLAPWIHIRAPRRTSSSSVQNTRSAYGSKKRKIAGLAHQKKIQLNTVDTLYLQQLDGIGPRLASRIVRYRDWLGGFTHFAQLSEVYGIDSLWVKRNLHRFEPLLPVRKINLNTCAYEELSRHPYITPELARALIAYRQQREPFADVADIRFSDLVDEELYRKLAPYLTTE